MDVPGANDPNADAAEPGDSAPGSAGPVVAMSERIQLVVEAAERAAAGIREDAREQARRYMEESRARADRMTMERVQLMSELTDALVRQAASVKQRSNRLLAALDAAAERLESERLESGPSPEPGGTGETPAELQPPGAESEARPPTAEAPPLRGSEDARLLAVQLAVAGNSRAEIEARLRDELGVTDAGALLDEVVGPERS